MLLFVLCFILLSSSSGLSLALDHTLLLRSRGGGVGVCGHLSLRQIHCQCLHHHLRRDLRAPQLLVLQFLHVLLRLSIVS